METKIFAHNIELDSSLKRFIETQVRKRTARHSERLKQVIVRIKDLNGPKGGNDKQCTVEIVQSVGASATSSRSAHQTEATIVSKRSANLYNCIHRALDRAVRTTLRKARKLAAYRASAVRRVKLEPQADFALSPSTLSATSLTNNQEIKQ